MHVNIATVAEVQRLHQPGRPNLDQASSPGAKLAFLLGYMHSEVGNR